MHFLTKKYVFASPLKNFQGPAFRLKLHDFAKYNMGDLKIANFALKMVTKFCKIWLNNAYNELFRLKESKFLLLFLLYNKVSNSFYVNFASLFIQNFVQ
jgi:hypothetical protein